MNLAEIMHELLCIKSLLKIGEVALIEDEDRTRVCEADFFYLLDIARDKLDIIYEDMDRRDIGG